MADTEPAPEGVGTSTTETPVEARTERPVGRTFYADLADLLDQRGWARGGHSREGLTLDEAVDHLLGTAPGSGADGASLARAARVVRHLRELTGHATLAAWNDAPERSLDDVTDLLRMASVAHPDD